MGKSLKDQGNDAFLAKQYDLAIQKYTEGIQQNEKNEKGETLLHILYANRSQTFIEQKKYIKALVDAQESLNVNPQYEKAQIRKASCLIDLKLVHDIKEYKVIPKEREDERNNLLTETIPNGDTNQPEYMIFGVHRNNQQLLVLQNVISISEKEQKEWERAERRYFQSECVSKTNDKRANDFINEIVSTFVEGGETELALVTSAILKHYPELKDKVKNNANFAGCWATVGLLAHLCSWGPSSAFLTVMEPLPSLLTNRKPILEHIKLQNNALFKPIHQLRVYKNSRDCVLYSLIGMINVNGGGHGCSMIQFPSVNGPIYRVVQSYGGTYGIGQWLKGHGETPFSDGWLNFEGAKAFWARVVSFYVSGQHWLNYSNHQFCFGCPPPENIFQNTNRSAMFFDCTPFDIDIATERLRDLKKELAPSN